ncbi:MAG: phosphate ABC transporter substrate-binding protein PstS [Desulfomonile tiedjei]|nr:phosphate ABC transporter substrate-binding protein PstS [Desulfomonile tiedjei]
MFLVALPGVVNAGPDIENVTGAGASFPYPVYAKWATKYNQYTGLKIAYQSIGSGGGIAQIKAKTVDFGASDEPLKAEDLSKDGLIQFPMIMGGVVPVANIEGVSRGKLKLTPELLADIFLGKIKKWNDRRIVAVNSDVKLPDQEITVVHRADGSGTTWIFTNYLSKVSSEWKEKIGGGKSVSWPTGVGGKGNEGVSALVKKTAGGIGYVEYAYALKERLKYVQLQNNAGKFITPTIETFQTAAANADWEKAPGFYIVLVDQPGEKSWPITGASYILMHKDQADPAKAHAVLKFFDWCFKNGADAAKELHYVPMPTKVFTLVESVWAKDMSAGGSPVWK